VSCLNLIPSLPRYSQCYSENLRGWREEEDKREGREEM